MPAIKIEDVYNDNALVSSDRLDKSFKWHRECYPWGHNYVEFEKEVPVPPGRIEKRAILRRVK